MIITFLGSTLCFYRIILLTEEYNDIIIHVTELEMIFHLIL